MHLNIIDATYCPWQDSIVTLNVCKGARKICQYYKGEQMRSDGVRELICSYGEKVDVIEKVTERECSRCYGSGIMKVGHPRQTGGSWKTGRFPCNVCNGTGKVKEEQP